MQAAPASLPARWLDGFAYGRRVLLGGADPWASATDLALFYKDLASLLSLDVIAVDVLPLLRSALAGPEGGGKAEPGAFGDLVGSPPFQDRLRSGLTAVKASAGGRPLALSLPGVGLLTEDLVDIGDDDMAGEDMALDLADLIRAVADVGLTYLLVRETAGVSLAPYEPLINVAEHLGIVLLCVRPGAIDENPGFALLYSEAGGTGRLLPDTWWTEAGQALEDGMPVFGTVPADTLPEVVQERLRFLP